MRWILPFLVAGFLCAGQYELKEDLVLGADDALDLFFTSHTRMAAHPDGRLYVLNPGQHRILVFNPAGELIRSFGKRGPGPGEFSEPVSLALDQAGRLHVFDAGFHKMVVFNPDGTLVREQGFANGTHAIYNPLILRDGNIAFTAYKLDETYQVAYDLSLYSPELELIQQLHITRLPKTDWRQPRDNAFWVAFLVGQLDAIARMPLHARMGNILVSGISGTYKGSLHDGQGKEIGRFGRDLKPRALSDAAKEALCEPVWQDLAANPTYSPLTLPVFQQALDRTENLISLPPMRWIISLGEGFAVLANLDPVKREGHLDLFDKKGDYLGSVAYQGPGQFLHGVGAKLYALGYDDEEDMVIKRYSLENL